MWSTTLRRVLQTHLHTLPRSYWGSTRKRQVPFAAHLALLPLTTAGSLVNLGKAGTPYQFEAGEKGSAFSKLTSKVASNSALLETPWIPRAEDSNACMDLGSTRVQVKGLV